MALLAVIQGGVTTRACGCPDAGRSEAAQRQVVAAAQPVVGGVAAGAVVGGALANSYAYYGNPYYYGNGYGYGDYQGYEEYPVNQQGYTEEDYGTNYGYYDPQYNPQYDPNQHNNNK